MYWCEVRFTKTELNSSNFCPLYIRPFIDALFWKKFIWIFCAMITWNSFYIVQQKFAQYFFNYIHLFCQALYHPYIKFPYYIPFLIKISTLKRSRQTCFEVFKSIIISAFFDNSYTRTLIYKHGWFFKIQILFRFSERILFKYLYCIKLVLRALVIKHSDTQN